MEKIDGDRRFYICMGTRLITIQEDLSPQYNLLMILSSSETIYKSTSPFGRQNQPTRRTAHSWRFRLFVGLRIDTMPCVRVNRGSSSCYPKALFLLPRLPYKQWKVRKGKSYIAVCPSPISFMHHHLWSSFSTIIIACSDLRMH